VAASSYHVPSSYRCHHSPEPSDWFVPPVQSQQWFFRQHVQEISNVTIGAVLWLVLAAGQLLFVHRLLAATRSGKRWCVVLMRICMCSHSLPGMLPPLLQHCARARPPACWLIPWRSAGACGASVSLRDACWSTR
jgi:hypothetical protein